MPRRLRAPEIGVVLLSAAVSGNLRGPGAGVARRPKCRSARSPSVLATTGAGVRMNASLGMADMNLLDAQSTPTQPQRDSPNRPSTA